jgi:hypothetical protein
MNALDWAAKLAEENGKEIHDAYLAAIKAGEWRAADSILDRIYGRPTEHVEMKSEPKSIDDLGRAEVENMLEREGRVSDSHQSRRLIRSGRVGCPGLGGAADSWR